MTTDSTRGPQTASSQAGAAGATPAEAAAPDERAVGARPALETRALGKTYGGLSAVSNVSLAVRYGEILGIIGPNGAGKSTLVGMIAGAIQPSGGDVVLDGTAVTGWRPQALAKLGLRRTFQVAAVFPRLTVLENLLLGVSEGPGESVLSVLGPGRRWRAREREQVRRARALLATFGLASKESEYAGNLSGGEQRLVEIMRTTMSEVRTLLLDEPMAGVNPRMMCVIEDYLLNLRSQGVAVIMIEHRMESVERMCDSVVVMARGEVIATGAMTDVRQTESVVNAYLVG